MTSNTTLRTARPLALAIGTVLHDNATGKALGTVTDLVHRKTSVRVTLAGDDGATTAMTLAYGRRILISGRSAYDAG